MNRNTIIAPISPLIGTLFFVNKITESLPTNPLIMEKMNEVIPKWTQAIVRT